MRTHPWLALVVGTLLSGALPAGAQPCQMICRDAKTGLAKTLPCGPAPAGMTCRNITTTPTPIPSPPPTATPAPTTTPAPSVTPTPPPPIPYPCLPVYAEWTDSSGKFWSVLVPPGGQFQVRLVPVKQ